MGRVYVFADEAGNFDFKRQQGASRYFILASVTFPEDHTVAEELHNLRTQLVWEGIDHPGEFHATTDRQVVRDRVFDVLSKHNFRIDATILEKTKAKPRVRPSDLHFYKTAWYFHMKHVAPKILTPRDELLVVAASLGTKRRREAFLGAVTGVVQQVSPTVDMRTAFWPASVDPRLQAADYCAWAVQRKWEGRDPRSYNLIKDKIASEFDLFRRGSKEYY